MELKHRFANYSPSTVSIYNEKRDMVLKEPSLVAVNSQTGAVTAAGYDAQAAAGSDSSIITGSPLLNGVIADFHLTRSMILFFLKKANITRVFFKPRMALFVPKELTMVDHKVYTELLLCLAARNALIMEESFQSGVRNLPSSYEVIVEVTP